MPIKLIQVQRKLNVGINTVVDFLRSKGFVVEDSNPNTRISDEQYDALVKEFGKNLPKDGDKWKKGQGDKLIEKKKVAPSATEGGSVEIKTVIPEEYRPRIVTKGHIDLEKGVPVDKETNEQTTKPVEDEAKPSEAVPVHQPVSSSPESDNNVVADNIMETRKEDVKETEVEVNKEVSEPVNKEAESSAPAASPAETGTTDGELFRLNTARLESNIKVTGKFDKFSTLGLDYEPAMRSSDKYIAFLIQRPDVSDHNLPLSEMKCFLPREEAEKYIELNSGDRVEFYGTVFSNALGDIWVDVKKFNSLEPKKEEPAK